MKLSKFKKQIDMAVKYAGDHDPDVEFWVGEKQYDIKNIGQFSIVPDVVISLEHFGSSKPDKLRQRKSKKDG